MMWQQINEERDERGFIKHLNEAMSTLFPKKTCVLPVLLGSNKIETMHCMTYFIYRINTLLPMWHSWKQQNEIVH
jgi:hypothetical protein